MQTRCEFMVTGGASLLSLAGAVPMFLPRTLLAEDSAADDGRILVVVELDGGNDGINTVIPFRDEGYARHRDALRISTERLIPISNDMGLHPSMRALADIWENGRLAIVQGAGYPNPNRSHFRSMEIWHSGTDASDDHFGLGWVGKGLDGTTSGTTGPLCMSVGHQTTPLALRGRRTISASVQRLDQYLIADETRLILNSIVSATPRADSDDLLQFVQRVHASALQSSSDLRAIAHRDARGERYPATAFGRQLQLTARLIRAGMRTRVYYTRQSGYDTHASQLPRHAALLGELSESLAAFLRDVDTAGLSDQVIVLAFSEFGRRVAENGGEGTDHGTAGPMFLAGAKVAAGFHGQAPSLTDTADGDLRMSVDFRQVYAAVLDNWLQVPSTTALGRRFEALPVVQA